MGCVWIMKVPTLHPKTPRPKGSTTNAHEAGTTGHPQRSPVQVLTGQSWWRDSDQYNVRQVVVLLLVIGA